MWRRYVLHTDVHAYVDIYVLCVCIVGHGCDYTTEGTFENLTPVSKHVKSELPSVLILNNLKRLCFIECLLLYRWMDGFAIFGKYIKMWTISKQWSEKRKKRKLRERPVRSPLFSSTIVKYRVYIFFFEGMGNAASWNCSILFAELLCSYG